MPFLLKTLLSAVLIAAIAELARRNTGAAGFLASLPLLSILALFWLYRETYDIGKVIALSSSIFWMVLPSLGFFLLLPLLLKRGLPFYGAMALSCLITSGFYYLALALYAKLGIRL